MAAAPPDRGLAADPAVEPSAAEFEAFDRFPWSKHRAFLAGLVETLGGVDALVPSPTHEGSSAFCRTVFFRMQTGRRVDLTRYHQFRAAHPAYPSVDQQLLAVLYATAATADAAPQTPAAKTAGDSDGPDGPGVVVDEAERRSRRVVDAVAHQPVLDAFGGAGPVSAATAAAAAASTTTPTGTAADDDSSSSIPSWMRSAPTAALHVERAGLQGTGGEAPHSDKFAQIVEAIQTGKPVEGIRQIPDTVVRRAGITPVGKLKARPKPWEVAAAAGADSDAEATPAGGLTSILSVLSLGEDGQKEDGPDGRRQQQQTTVLEFPPLPEESASSSSAEAEAAASEPEKATAA